MAEIDDGELATLRKTQTLLDNLLRSPKTKRATERAIKTLHPETVTSEDFEEPLREEVKAIGTKLDKFLETQTTREQDSELERAFDKLRTDGGYTDDGIDKVKKLMVDRKIADPLAAAAYYEKLNPAPEPQKPTPFAGLSWGFGAKTDDASTKLLFEDEDAWAEKETAAVLTEIAQQKG